jgi:hypothetical protein
MDGRTSSAHAASQRAGPLRDGVVDAQKLPAAESRGCQPMARKLTTCLIDALVKRGSCDLVADPPTALTRAGVWMRALTQPQMRSARPDCLSGLTGIDSLTLIFPAEAYAAG